MTKDTEWGNIELPGLSDEKLLATNWNRVSASRDAVIKRSQTAWKPNIIKRNKKMAESEQWQQAHLAAAVKRKTENSDWRNNVISANQAKGADLEFRKTLSQAHLKLYQDPEHVKKHQEGREKMKNNGVWADNVRKAARARRQAVVTPQGAFNSRPSVCEHYKIDITTLGRWLKNKPTEFYYISQEEYTLLTGKEF